MIVKAKTMIINIVARFMIISFAVIMTIKIIVFLVLLILEMKEQVKSAKNNQT